MAIDRRNGTEVAMETVKLAEEFMLSSDGLVVGLDLSGDPTVSRPCQKEMTLLLLILCIITDKMLDFVTILPVNECSFFLRLAMAKTYFLLCIGPRTVD